MSGVDAVAGLVLGLLPLIISAIKNYEVTFQPFLTYHRYPKELRNFKTNLATQKQLFENHCLALLVRRLDPVEAEGILRERTDQRWKADNMGERERDMERRLREYLGQSFEACISLLILIRGTLNAVQEETKDLDDMSGGGRVLRTLFRQKTKFSFSKPRLYESVAKLRELNRDFLALTESIGRVEKVRAVALYTTKRVANEPLRKFKMIQAASLNLHEALGGIWDCSIHRVHRADICVAGDIDEVPSLVIDTQAERVCFDIAFTPLLALARDPRGKTIWLKIESNLGEPGNPYTDQTGPAGSGSSANDLTRTLEQEVGAFLGRADREIPNPKKECKKVTFQATLEDRKPGEVMTAVVTNPLPNLVLRRDLCLHLLQRCQTQNNTPTCVGVLDKSTQKFKHVVYRPPWAPRHPAKPMSLEAVVASVSGKKPEFGLTGLERIRLARSLATAVLQFHSTPWLPDDWRSGDICFYDVDVDTLQKPGMLEAPRLSVRFPHRTDAVGPQMRTRNPSSSPIRNNVLFGLGAVLLELGFETTLDNLQREEDLKAGKEHELTEYLVAMRLSNTAGTPLGGRYGRIIRRCLNCEFGDIGYDLDSPKLQESFYRNVVCEIEELERGFERLDL